jgi:hypothetical protein
MENPFKHMLGKTITKDTNPDLDLRPAYREPNRAERRAENRRQKKFWQWRTRHKADGTVMRDRWEWKPTQSPPAKRKERNRRRGKIAHKSRVANR